MDKETNKKRGFGRKISKGNLIKCIIWCIAALLFTIWVGDFWPLIIVVLIIDAYWTKFIPWTWWRGIKNPFLRGVMSWIDAIVFALVAVYFLQNFLFQNYQIPTTSLEKTMLAGDYLLVSKAEYGPRIPMTPLSLPLFQHTIAIGDKEYGKSYLEKPQVKYQRMAGIRNIDLYDIVVFNYPAGDTVASLHQNDDYYRLCFQYGRETVNSDKATFGEILYRPVDRRENYVKRCIGLPGDTLQIIDNKVFINSLQLEDPKYLQQSYLVRTKGGLLPEKIWKSLGVNREDVMILPGGELHEVFGFHADTLTGQYPPLYRVTLTQEMIAKLKRLSNVDQIILEPTELFQKDYVYPRSETNPWTRSNYGPIWIPKAGASIELTPENVALYERCIRNYEGNQLTRNADGTYSINGKPATSYTFRMDYYWMMGDNRDNSADSRYWGFVPEDHIVGTPLFVWFSIDKETGRWRWERMLKKVRGI